MASFLRSVWRQSGSQKSAASKSLVRSFANRTRSTPDSSSFLPGASGPYVEQMYEAWQQDPLSVHASWRAYFANVSSGKSSSASFQAPPAFTGGEDASPLASAGFAVGDIGVSGGSSSDILDHLKVQLLVRAYQVRGHNLADLDPLGIMQADLEHENPVELDPKHYGFTDADLDRVFHLGHGMLPGFLSKGKQITLREIIQSLQDVYCGKIGVEYTHVPSRIQCDWLRNRFEVPRRFEYSLEDKKRILDRLIWSDSFERFVAQKWTSEKRFGLEGGESLIPGMKAMIDRAVDAGVKTIVMGMPHRGRLNVLSNVVRKPNESIFCEFSGSLEPQVEGSGDVKYHLGMNYDRPTPSGKRVHLSLVANPSHLEAVNPVVEGQVRAIQFYSQDEKAEQTMPILLHGDAAFAAQGVVYETLGFCDLPSYATGGTIHIVVNNQIGFTTDPRFARSTPYCTDVAKVVNAPILHVNGDDAESVVYACQLAADWRQEFKKDIVVDIVCYRRHGHNEIDQPSFTQPLMYKKIAKQPTTLDIYVDKLVKEGTMTMDEIDQVKARVWSMLEESYAASKDYKQLRSEWVSTRWTDFKSLKELAEEVVPAHPTGVKQSTLKEIGSIISTVPEGFTAHAVLKRILKARQSAVDQGDSIDWATAEHMAFGSLCMEGIHVRLSGQDVERGTFSHRHAVLHDQSNEEQYVALNHISPNQGKFLVCNSSLSEFGTLGFELGYSLVDPRSLVMWEAQFGDFANNAQCIIDQFIASGEAKWLQRTGLTMLLPHGYDGAGPEHSSARLERFLQLCDEDPNVFPPTDPKLSRQIQDCNMQVVYCTTPANYFHALRRQVHRDFRKPLIVLNSKLLLRHPLCKSPLSDMIDDTMFQRAIMDSGEGLASAEKVKKVVFCSGQVYYALARAREANKVDDVAICRVEQISPFPFDLVAAQADKYPNADVMWAQEEPMNMGAWTYVEPRIETALKHTKNHQSKRAQFSGREPTGAVATGNKKQHQKEEESLLSKAIIGEVRKAKSYQNGAPVW
eukprot:Partr_v1_DN25496_c0_g1_i1_m53622 putative 2oxoglutarate dehydrogenase